MIYAIIGTSEISLLDHQIIKRSIDVSLIDTPAREQAQVQARELTSAVKHANERERLRRRNNKANCDALDWRSWHVRGELQIGSSIALRAPANEIMSNPKDLPVSKRDKRMTLRTPFDKYPLSFDVNSLNSTMLCITGTSGHFFLLFHHFLVAFFFTLESFKFSFSHITLDYCFATAALRRRTQDIHH
jgi:hypothetical protein